MSIHGLNLVFMFIIWVIRQDLRSQLSNERESTRKDILQKDVELREIRSKMEVTVCIENSCFALY